MKPNKNFVLFQTLIILLSLFFIFGLLKGVSDRSAEISDSEFYLYVQKNKIAGKLTIVDKHLVKGRAIVDFGAPPNQNEQIIPFIMNVDTNDPDFYKNLRTHNIDFEHTQSANLSWIFNLIPFLFIVFVFMFMMKKGGMGGGGISNIIKSKFNKIDPDKIEQSFANVAGLDEEKEEVTEVVDFLKNPKKFAKIGAKIPKGVLLVGPPGTGKTLLAKAIAKEAGVPFYSGSGSQFVEMFVGVGASRVRELFTEARNNAPCIIFIDEIDAVGGKRDMSGSSGHSEKEQTINEMLTQMDGFDTTDGVIVIAATNRPDMLDQALVRAGRFDRQIHVRLPDVVGREEIFKIHAKKITLHDDVDLKTLAKGTPGFSGAEIANLVNEAAIMASRKGKEIVSMQDFESAKDKIIMGVERKTMVMPKEEKVKTAYHEAGHTIVNMFYKKTLDHIHKVTIIPRGRALGVTQTLPASEQYNYSKQKCLDMICMLLAGRGAEKLIYNEFTTGASNDIEKATQLAYNMVYAWGMNDQMGPLNYTDNGGPYNLKHKFSDNLRSMADQEVRTIILEQEKKTEVILKKYEDKLKTLANALVEKETLDASEVKLIVGEFDEK